MAITDALVLPEDVLLVPVRDLPADLIRGLGADDDDYALTRPQTRAASKIVDSQSARLLESFRQPTTVVAAVIAFSKTQKTDPEATLEGAFPLIQSLLHAGVLVPADSDRAARITSSFDVDDEIDGFCVRRCVQVVEDTEV